MKIDHLESVLYSQVKDSTENEDLKGSSWKGIHQLENLLALALDWYYKKNNLNFSFIGASRELQALQDLLTDNVTQDKIQNFTSCYGI